MRHYRYWLARHLIHVGLKVMPAGPCREELYAVLGAWGRHVIATLDAQR